MVAVWSYTEHMDTQQQDRAHTNVRLPRELLERMRWLSRDHARSLNREIEVAVREYVERHRREAEQAAKQAS